MTKGIRAFTNETFKATLPQLGELGAIAFRREVMAQVVMAFDISVASAATHYNHALKMAKVENPEAVATLGRAEDKKGGRKPKAKVEGTVVEEQQTEFTVKRKKDGVVIAEALSFEAATALVEKAVAAKKAKLYWV